MNLAMPACDLGPDYLDELESAHACEPSIAANSTGTHQMKIGQMTASKYLKKDDVDPPLLLTIRGFEEENVSPDDKPKDMKWVMYFEELEKGMVLNTTNLQLAAIALGSQDTDDWIGKQLVAFNDPSVSYAGKVTGGIRVRGPKKKPGQSAPKNPDPRPEPPTEDPDDDIPF